MTSFLHKSQITVLVSGQGTNLEAIINATSIPGVLNAEVNLVISNKTDACALTKAINASIPTMIHLWLKESMDRVNYDCLVAESILSASPPTNLIVLVGWMHVLTDQFLDLINRAGIPIINLHPALPGQFPGAHAIKDAFIAYQQHKISYTGIMVHYVVPQIDAGEMITQTIIPIYPEDSLEILQNRIRFHEKGVLLQGIQTVLAKIKQKIEKIERIERIEYPLIKCRKIAEGKVREIWEISDHVLALVHTDRVSSFDRYICDVPGKGELLANQSAWWFEQTKDLFPNHFLYLDKNIMYVKKATPIPIEVVIRAYMSGSTATSLWTHYEVGERTYCGITFPEGLIKNQRLSGPVITPTTKDAKHDELISEQELIDRGLTDIDTWNRIYQATQMLFAYARSKVGELGYILADTKMEFGIDSQTGTLMVIDELFTCDSSRYWLKDSYLPRLAEAKDPESLDKDLIRQYVKERCDPYHDPIPDIPQDLIKKVKSAYEDFYVDLIEK